MTLTRGKRITLEVLFPPGLAAGLMTGYSTVLALLSGIATDRLIEELPYVLITFVYAYTFGLLPSATYMALMELAFSRGLEPRGWRMVALSGALGLLAGLASAALMTLWFSSNARIPMWVNFSLFGLIVGLLIGQVVRFLSSSGETDDLRKTA